MKGYNLLHLSRGSGQIPTEQAKNVGFGDDIGNKFPQLGASLASGCSVIHIKGGPLGLAGPKARPLFHFRDCYSPAGGDGGRGGWPGLLSRVLSGLAAKFVEPA
jgi:hypothetical protein